MIGTKQLNEVIDKLAPYTLAESWDNCGLLVDCGGETGKILFALDAANEVIEEADALGCGILVTHHPAIFAGVKVLPQGDPVLEAARHNISLIAAHTCYDAAAGGVNDVLCDLLGVAERASIAPIGRSGRLASPDARSLAALVREKLGCGPVRFVDGGHPIEKVAVVGGAGGDFVAQARWLGLDALITGELKYHEALYAKQLGLTVVAAGHYETENPAVAALCAAVQQQIGDAAQCIVASVGANPFQTI